MRTVIKGLAFLIIGLAVIAFTAISATVIAAVLGGVFVGWLATLPARNKFRSWRNERRSQVR